jgi:hypothetical protein
MNYRGEESFGNLTAEARRAHGFRSRVSGFGLAFELETQDAGLGTEKYLSLVNVIHCKTARAQYLKRLVSGAAEVGWFW